MTTSSGPQPTAETGSPGLSWRLLRLLNLYRFLLISLVLGLFLLGEEPRLVGAHHPTLLLWAMAVYSTFAALSATSLTRRQPSLTVQGMTQIAADIVAVTLLLYASGGVSSGVGSLLFLPIGAGSLVLNRRPAVLLAAVSALAILSQQAYLQLQGLGSASDYTQAGLLGAVFFFASLTGTTLASRMRESEALAARRELDLANLSQLNEYIIEHMQTGVIALDDDGQVRLINHAAIEFLGPGRRRDGLGIAQVSELLHRHWQRWKEDPSSQPVSFTAADSDTAIIPHFTSLGANGTLVFLEDTRLASEQVQQMKLAALGRLTASIAHELRNPLGAVSHAGELLAEGETDPETLARLTRIIGDNAKRMNAIIENVLQLSRREWVTPSRLDLDSWLDDFLRDFTQMRELDPERIALERAVDGAEVRMDPSHLEQVLGNLCDNALRHAGDAPVLIRLTRAEDGASSLEVEDRGPGVPQALVDRIFEPFYTSASTGTGLGLFIARELCECNRAQLDYRPAPDAGSIFRIRFSNPDQWVT